MSSSSQHRVHRDQVSVAISYGAPKPTACRRPQIVVIGGGTGLPVVLQGLSEAAHLRGSGVARLTAVVTMTDDGGSSGRLRHDLGIPPPGDVRNCLAALADTRSPMSELLRHRFTGGGTLNGHAVGNLLLAAMTQMTGDFVTAVERMGEILGVRGRVLPSTRENVTLRAEFADGGFGHGETAIVARRTPIKRVWLERPVRPVPEVLRSLINADAIVVGPGSLYTSILPNLLIGGVASTLYGVNAIRIYVANLMTEPGETDHFDLYDHLRAIREHVGLDLFDYVIVNRRPPDAAVAAEYASRGAQPVPFDRNVAAATAAQIVERDLAWSYEGGKIRHAPTDLACAILELVEAGRPDGS